MSTSVAASELAQGGDLVIYDGECRFCAHQISRIRRLDRSDRLRFISLHDPRVRTEYPELSHDQLMAEMAIVTRDGQTHWGADALRYLTRRLPTLWCLAPLLHLPFTQPIWSWLYRQVARRRYLFGRLESCESGACRM